MITEPYTQVPAAQLARAPVGLCDLLIAGDPGCGGPTDVALAQESFRVWRARSVADALACKRGTMCSIVLASQGFSGGGSSYLFRALRAQNSARYIYLIQIVDCADQLYEGIDDWIAQSAPPEEFLARLRSARRIVLMEQGLRIDQQRSQQLGLVEKLTGLYTRKYFDSELGDELVRVRSGQYHFALLLARQIRRQGGRSQAPGTSMWTWMSELTRGSASCIRHGTDWVARLTDDTCAIVLPATDRTGALAVRLRLSKCALRTAGAGLSRSIQCGIGIAEVRDCPNSTGELLARAEADLNSNLRESPAGVSGA